MAMGQAGEAEEQELARKPRLIRQLWLLAAEKSAVEESEFFLKLGIP
jgi:hypothetical protein